MPSKLSAVSLVSSTASDRFGTHPTRGLLLDYGAGRPFHATLGVVKGASPTYNSSPEHKSPPNALDDPHGSDDMRGAPDPHTAFMADRKAVYRENILPHRPATSLLGLMWHALKDKVLVCHCSAHGPLFPSYSLFRSYYP